jgi:F-type H+-transporting ATPase subunit delta
MISESLARRYSVALFNLAVKRNKLDRIKDEYGLIFDVIESNSKFRSFLYSPQMDREEKKRIIQTIFGDKISKTLLHFLLLLLDKKRQTLVEKIYTHFDTLYNNHYNKAAITIRPAVSLDASMLVEIRKGFEKRLNKAITINEIVDPSLIGGLQVRVNNTVYDASVAGKLQRLRLSLS